ncbi:hypothetical protein NLM27_23470 [Bradyrhizobium sp. CCGB12]|uniref:hypothetical protein n=1 Tax=Bradyrhizobium sp. CCGB12 TaxID=2949632 RepID=UPI0020B2AD86|nr:hypothetical protein [Bradyrhizobium sp. CCGB12]MCP3391755.1 hypothetical protein [Bradyrhizobium sp. CCGB12]
MGVTLTVRTLPADPWDDEDWFSELARLIAGGEPPWWLRRFLVYWSRCVRVAIAQDGRRLTRKKVLDRLVKAGKELKAARDVLNEPQLMAFVVPPNYFFEHFGGLDLALVKLEGMIERAKSSPRLVHAGGKIKNGASKAVPEDVLSAQVLCAAIIYEVSAVFTRGEYFAPSNAYLGRCALKLWECSGGEIKSWGNQPHRAWRPYFVEAKERPRDDIRAELKGCVA